MDVDIDNCVLTKVFDPEPLLKPCLVDFEYGTITKRDCENVEAKMLVENGSEGRTLVLSKKGLSYSGKLGDKKSQLCQTLLLIRNKKTNMAKMIPFESCTVVSVKNRPKVSNVAEDSMNISYNESVHALSQAFGSKKSKKISEMKQRMSLQAHISETMTEDIADVSVNDFDISMNFDKAEAAVLASLPPCDRTAQDISKVYELSKLVSDAELKSLTTLANFYLQNPPSDSDQKTCFFIYSLYSSLGPDPPLSSIQIILFANALVTFVNMNASEFKHKTAVKTICPSSLTISNRILNEFTTIAEHSRTRPVHLRDKAVCYVMVLMLLLNNYRLNLDILTSSIKNYGYKKLMQLAKMVGLSSTSSKGSKILILKLPLPQLPVINKGRASKK